jgi:hypothetical protein
MQEKLVKQINVSAAGKGTINIEEVHLSSSVAFITYSFGGRH